MYTKRQVLVIEDNPDMVDQFRRTLQREGFDVFAASIPLEAEAMASGLRPTLIVMDVNFSGGAGWNILARLKERDDTFDVPVIVVSLSDEAQKIAAAGAFAFIQRPFMPEQLLEAVRAAEQESSTERILIIDDHPERPTAQATAGRARTFPRSRQRAAHRVSMAARRRPDLSSRPANAGYGRFAVLRELRPTTRRRISRCWSSRRPVNEDEHEKLADGNHVRVDIGQEAHEHFIREVHTHLCR
jgi:DNA-binding response OmpR family regulator